MFFASLQLRRGFALQAEERLSFQNLFQVGYLQGELSLQYFFTSYTCNHADESVMVERPQVP